MIGLEGDVVQLKNDTLYINEVPCEMSVIKKKKSGDYLEISRVNITFPISHKNYEMIYCKWTKEQKNEKIYKIPAGCVCIYDDVIHSDSDFEVIEMKSILGKVIRIKKTNSYDEKINDFQQKGLNDDQIELLKLMQDIL